MMRKIVAGPAIWLGGVAESPADWRGRPRGPAAERVSRA
jgi:hypothetical protein